MDGVPLSARVILLALDDIAIENRCFNVDDVQTIFGHLIDGVLRDVVALLAHGVSNSVKNAPSHAE
jgi:hypothetical protein